MLPYFEISKKYVRIRWYSLCVYRAAATKKEAIIKNSDRKKYNSITPSCAVKMQHVPFPKYQLKVLTTTNAFDLASIKNHASFAQR